MFYLQQTIIRCLSSQALVYTKDLDTSSKQLTSYPALSCNCDYDEWVVSSKQFCFMSINESNSHWYMGIRKTREKMKLSGDSL